MSKETIRLIRVTKHSRLPFMALRIQSRQEETSETPMGLRETSNQRDLTKAINDAWLSVIVQELCESRGGRPGLSVLTSLLVSVDIKIY